MNKLFFVISILFIISCSKEQTLEEKLEGQWYGVITQKDCCTFDTDITITTLIQGKIAAEGRYSNTDFSICNNDILFCEEIKKYPVNCSFNWKYTLSTGSTVTFLETPLDSDNCASGIVTLSLINDDMISRKWVDLNDETNISDGILKRK